MTPQFQPGERVRVLRGFPPGHCRTPWYCRGQTGVVERVCGEFGNPEQLAYGLSGGPPRPLYRVRFRQAELWPAYRGPRDDTIEIDIYQHWLEPAKD